MSGTKKEGKTTKQDFIESHQYVLDKTIDRLSELDALRTPYPLLPINYEKGDETVEQQDARIELAIKSRDEDKKVYNIFVSPS